jgi:hypothetical protein
MIMTTQQERTLLRTKIRQLINYVFELERRGDISMDDWFAMVNDLDNFLELLNEREHNGR